MRYGKQLKSIAQNLILLFITFTVLGVVFEIGVRNLAPQGDSFYELDDDLGSKLSPGKEGVWNINGRAIPIKINPYGFRGWETQQEKDPTTVRIAILGDSFIEAFQVEENKMLHKQLEKWIEAEKTIDKVEVLSFGVSGYGTAQQYLLYRKYVALFDPDIVISVMTSANDVRNNHPDLEKDTNRSYFILEDGELKNEKGTGGYTTFYKKVLGEGFLKGVNQFLLNHSQAYRLMIRTFIKVVSGDKNKTQDIPIDFFVFSCDYDEKWKEAWSVTYAILSQWREEVEKEGKKWMLVNGTADVQIQEEKGLDRLMELYPDMRGQCWNLEKPNEMLEAWANQEGARYLDLLPIFKRDYQDNALETHLPEDGHWNEYGHQKAAEAIGNFILALP